MAASAGQLTTGYQPEDYERGAVRRSDADEHNHNSMTRNSGQDQKSGRDELGPDHPDCRKPRNLHKNRFREPRRSPNATALPRIFRGYSIFMKGKDPRDAHFITSRICGICGDNHATCATYAQNMAFGVRPPAMAEWIINLGEAAEYMFDHNIFQDNLVGVDFCEQMVKETNPGVLAKAEKTLRRHAELHGYPHDRRHHAALNPFSGAFYRETLQMSRDDARDVLPDGRPARASINAVSGRRRHGADRRSFSPIISSA